MHVCFKNFFSKQHKKIKVKISFNLIYVFIKYRTHRSTSYVEIEYMLNFMLKLNMRLNHILVLLFLSVVWKKEKRKKESLVTKDGGE